MRSNRLSCINLALVEDRKAFLDCQVHETGPTPLAALLSFLLLASGLLIFILTAIAQGMRP